MISTLLELLALAGLVKTASYAAAWAAWLVASLGLGFVGYALSGSPVDMRAQLLISRAKRVIRRQPEPETNGNGPHPALYVDPEAQARSERMAVARQRRSYDERGRWRDRIGALSRAPVAEDDDS